MSVAADSQSFPISFPVSGVTDAEGNATITVPGFVPGLAAAWNIYMNLPGNAPQVQIFQGSGIGGIPIGSGGAVNGQCQVGPVYSYGSAAVTIRVTGAEPSLPIEGVISGLQSSDPADLSAISGQSSQTVGTTTAYDGQTLIAESAALGNNVHNADVTYPTDGGVFDVRLWASVLLGIRMNTAATGKAVLITFRWFANEDGSRLIGQESCMVDDFVTTVVATLPNLGPFLQVVVNRLPLTASFDWNASLLTSQRIVSAVYGGNFTPYLAEIINQNIAAGNTFTNPLGTVYAGPCWVSLRATGGQPGTFRINGLSTDGTYHTGNVFQDSEAAGNVFSKIVILPATACQVSITNTGAGAGNFTMVVYSSPTGSG